MTRRPAGLAVAALALVVLLALATFLVLNEAFGGPSPVPDGRRVEVRFHADDAQRLVSKSPVMVRGVAVGEVRRLERVGRRSRVTLAIDPERTPLWRDASVRIGRRTLFGEAYVRLDPGHRARGPLRGGTVRLVAEAVELDEALEALDRRTRAHVASLVRTGGAVAEDPQAAARLNATLGALPRLVDGLRRMNAVLVPQSGALADLLTDTAAVSEELARRDAQLRGLVGAAHTTLAALAATGAALPAGLAEAQRLLRTSTQALRAVRPVVDRLDPLLPLLDRAAPVTTEALRAVPDAADGITELAATLPALRRAAQARLPELRGIALDLPALAGRLTPVLRNLVPTVRYAEPHGSSVIGFVGGGTAIRELRSDGTARAPSVERVAHLEPFPEMGEDGAPYGWARFFVGLTPGVLLGQPIGGVTTNPYPQPTRFFEGFSGTYPRLLPAPEPPLRTTGR